MAKRKKNTSTATGRSPYRKYEKRPFRYSSEYYDWFNASKQGTKFTNDRDAQAANYAWHAKFNSNFRRTTSGCKMAA